MRHGTRVKAADVKVGDLVRTGAGWAQVVGASVHGDPQRPPLAVRLDLQGKGGRMTVGLAPDLAVEVWR